MNGWGNRDERDGVDIRVNAKDLLHNLSSSLRFSRICFVLSHRVVFAFPSSFLFFYLSSLSSQELDVGRISIRVINYGKLFTTTIGAFQYGMADVYAKPGHEVSRQWIALADTNDPEAVGVRVRTVCE